MHHYTVHVKIGIAREYLDELQQTLNSQKLDLATATAFEFNKILTGGMAVLVGGVLIATAGNSNSTYAVTTIIGLPQSLGLYLFLIVPLRQKRSVAESMGLVP